MIFNSLITNAKSAKCYTEVLKSPGSRARHGNFSRNHASEIRMTNDEIRRNDEIRMTKSATAPPRAFRNSCFGFHSSFVIRYSSFNHSDSWSQWTLKVRSFSQIRSGGKRNKARSTAEGGEQTTNLLIHLLLGGDGKSNLFE